MNINNYLILVLFILILSILLFIGYSLIHIDTKDIENWVAGRNNSIICKFYNSLNDHRYPFIGSARDRLFGTNPPPACNQ